LLTKVQQVASDADEAFDNGINYATEKVTGAAQDAKMFAVQNGEKLGGELKNAWDGTKEKTKSFLSWLTGQTGGRRRRRSAHRRKGRTRRGGTGEPQQGYDQLVAANFPSTSNFKGDNIYDLLKMNGGRRTRRRKPHYHGRKSKCYKRH
jgi:hypothetical protein